VEPAGVGTLDAGERARAARFRFERDRRRFVARRLFLRAVLAEHMGVEPAGIRYRASGYGKPELDLADAGIAFSTSHADDLAIVAVVRGGEVGADIERIRTMRDALDIARKFFTACEVEHLSSLTGASRSAAFLRLWTGKEAYVKLLGRGLSMPLDGFDVVGLDRLDRVELDGTAERPAASLWSVDVPKGYLATVALGVAARPVEPPLQLAIAS
jgi:4'-phosphopantetheinyl transferase